MDDETAIVIGIGLIVLILLNQGPGPISRLLAVLMAGMSASVHAHRAQQAAQRMRRERRSNPHD